MARQDHHRDLKHDTAAREDLRQRRHCADSLPPHRRDLREELRGQEGEVSGSDGPDAAVRDRPRTAGEMNSIVDITLRVMLAPVYFCNARSARSPKWSDGNVFRGFPSRIRC